MNAKTVNASLVLAVLGVLTQDAYAIKLQGSDAVVYICPHQGREAYSDDNTTEPHGCRNGKEREAALSFEAAVLLAATPLTQRIELLEGEVQQKDDQIAVLTLQLEHLIREVNDLKQSSQPE